jgi:hypothetical protein
MRRLEQKHKAEIGSERRGAALASTSSSTKPEPSRMKVLATSRMRGGDRPVSRHRASRRMELVCHRNLRIGLLDSTVKGKPDDIQSNPFQGRKIECRRVRTTALLNYIISLLMPIRPRPLHTARVTTYLLTSFRGKPTNIPGRPMRNRPMFASNSK